MTADDARANNRPFYDDRLVWLLNRAGDEWGPLGVAKAAAALAGVEWAAARAETTTVCTCDAAPAEIGGASHRPGCGEAETTTATTEDIDRLAHSKDVRVYGDYGAGWRDGVKAAAGLLARPTPSRDDISDAIEHSGIAIGTTDAEQAAEAERRYPSGAVPEATLTYPTDALREHSRGAFVAGAEWAAGRAETTAATPPTTATDEDAARRLYNALRRAWPEGYADPEDVEDWSYWEEIARDAGLLATARTRPTRQQLARAIDDVIGDVDLHDVTRAEMDQATEQAADAVLALFDEEADRG